MGAEHVVRIPSRQFRSTSVSFGLSGSRTKSPNHGAICRIVSRIRQYARALGHLELMQDCRQVAAVGMELLVVAHVATDRRIPAVLDVSLKVEDAPLPGVLHDDLCRSALAKRSDFRQMSIDVSSIPNLRPRCRAAPCKLESRPPVACGVNGSSSPMTSLTCRRDRNNVPVAEHRVASFS